MASSLKRITISEIRKHPWFLKNLPRELTEAAQAAYYKRDNSAPIYSLQSIEDIMKIVKEARLLPISTPVSGFGWAEEEDEDDEAEDGNPEEEDEEEDEYEKQVKEVHASGEYQIS